MGKYLGKFAPPFRRLKQGAGMKPGQGGPQPKENGGIAACEESGFVVCIKGMNICVPLTKKTTPDWRTSIKERKGKGGEKLRPAEYDFSKVPTRELHACLNYEYARESERILDNVNELREQWRKALQREIKDVRRKGEGDIVGKRFKVTANIRKFSSIEGTAFESWFLIALAGCEGFPSVAWQELPAEKREAMINFPRRAVAQHNQAMLRAHPPLIIETAEIGSALSQMPLGTWARKSLPAKYAKIVDQAISQVVVPGFFIVNFLQSPDLIMERFKAWLLKTHPKGREAAKEARGRKSLRDRLNALGALRLRYYCRTLNEAQDVIAPLRNSANGLYYSDRTAWNRACCRAAEYFREILVVPEPDLPIHFTKGWQK